MANVPTVTAQAPSNVGPNTATLNGTITLADSGGNATVQGFNWGLTTAYGNVASSSGSFGSGVFSQTIKGLDSSVTYHYQAFATGPTGTGVSADATFVALSGTTISADSDGSGRYRVIDHSWPPDGPRTMGHYESLRDAQNSLLSAGDQQRLAMGTPFSTLSSVQVV